MVKLNKMVIGDALPYGVSNLLPAGTEVVVLDDGPNYAQVVVTRFLDRDFEWISDGRVIAVDWAVFQDAVGAYPRRVR